MGSVGSTYVGQRHTRLTNGIALLGLIADDVSCKQAYAVLAAHVAGERDCLISQRPSLAEADS